MKNESKKKTLTDWDWTTLVASWRYYEHGHTIASAMFPHEIVRRFFMGAYDEESCKKIARQFVEIDHRYGPNDKISGWVGDDAFGASDRKAWRLFYFYLSACLHGFKPAKAKIGCQRGPEDLFQADGKWYSRIGYEMFGADVSPYNGNEFEFVK